MYIKIVYRNFNKKNWSLYKFLCFLYPSSIPTRGNEIFIKNLYFNYFAVVSKERSSIELRHWTMGNAILRNSAENGEQSVLTLGSLCLSCCVRYTAWSWFIHNITCLLGLQFHSNLNVYFGARNLRLTSSIPIPKNFVTHYLRYL